ncbi:MAG: hypothetical protein HRT61_01230 [Ekhidna sp.]|nr:hypothetical protein [Ekhidna sp.]
MKNDKQDLQLENAHLEADKENLSLRLNQASERQERATITREEFLTAIKELKDEPVTSDCGPSVRRALDYLRVRDNEVVENESNS